MIGKIDLVQVLRALRRFVLYFAIVAFAVSCCTMLFVTTMTSSMGLTLTNEDIQRAAKLTMINVFALTVILTVIDIIRTKLTVERPVKRIVSAAEKIMRGDFSVRIEKRHAPGLEDHFDEIAECFNRMAEELSGTETLRTDFIANVSHELKTPLAVIGNYGAMLSDPELSYEKRVEYAKIISDTSRSLSSLITNILKLNKLENQQISPSMKSYDLSEQLCECLLAFEGAWEAKGLNIETDIDDGIFVVSDEQMQSLVWNNLFSNAIKFTDKGGTVSVSLRCEGSFAVVRITDTGCGISPEVGAHMFDKFYQGDTSHSGEGNGLGLALVRRAIDITGCDISVESKLGEGTVFTVKLPLQ